MFCGSTKISELRLGLQNSLMLNPQVGEECSLVCFYVAIQYSLRTENRRSCQLHEWYLLASLVTFSSQGNVLGNMAIPIAGHYSMFTH